MLSFPRPKGYVSFSSSLQLKTFGFGELFTKRKPRNMDFTVAGLPICAL